MFISLHRELSWSFCSSYLISSLMLNYYEKQYKLNKMAKVQAKQEYISMRGVQRVARKYTTCTLTTSYTILLSAHRFRFAHTHIATFMHCRFLSCSFILSRSINVYSSWLNTGDAHTILLFGFAKRRCCCCCEIDTGKM